MIELLGWQSCFDVPGCSTSGVMVVQREMALGRGVSSNGFHNGQGMRPDCQRNSWRGRVAHTSGRL